MSSRIENPIESSGNLHRHHRQHHTGDEDKAALFSYTSNSSTTGLNRTSHFSASSLNSSSCSTSSYSSTSSGSSRSESLSKSDFHLVGDKIRPTLKCIRNTLNLGIDSTKRYDRLSSSKSDLHLTGTESSVDESDVQLSIRLDLLPKKSHQRELSSTRSESVGSKQNSTGGTYSNCTGDVTAMPGLELASANSTSTEGNAGTMLSTNTFRSFIKTKSSGIIIRKDNNDEDDEEVEKLCDSEASKLSTECPTTPSHTESGSYTTRLTNGQEARLISVPNTPHSGHGRTSATCHSSCSSECCTRPYVAFGQHPQQRISCCAPNGGHTYNQQSSTSLSMGQHHHKCYQEEQSCSTEATAMRHTKPPGSESTSKTNVSKRPHRNHFIPPLLKPNRFVKHSKGNLLFSAHGKGHKSGQIKKRMSTENVFHDTSQEIVESLKSDRMVMTQPDEDRRRRTIIIEKQNNSFGFTLQTYGIKHGQEGEVELITYVDEVTYGGPAFRGGMRPGDVILSINGRDVEKADHRTLVNYINSCEKTMRLVVLFEDCVRKIELHLKYIKLKKALQYKLSQLEILNQRENQILLNAALRARSQVKDKNENVNMSEQLNEETIENIDGHQVCISNDNMGQLKKYKCKSLDVSLNDINCNDNALTGGGQWIEKIENNQANNNTATTLPRNLRDAKAEDSEVLVGLGEEPSECQASNRQNSLRSKSLPQSVANSLDCLTNEAYEDDEDLLGDSVAWSPTSRSPTNSAQPTESLVRHQHNKGGSLINASDKDFITKL